MSDDFRRIANLSPNQRRLLEQRLGAANDIAEPIAIVGMSCRFPGASNLDAYWRLIADGVDASDEIPSSRWNIDALYDPTGEQLGKMSVRRAALVADVDKFDAAFFGVAPREAAKMDPQQRLLLEVAWEAFEVAGWAPDRMSGSATGVYIGIGGQDYSRIPSQYDDYFRYIDAHVGTGTALSIAANRLSYALDLRGPSVAVDTACSSSSVAIHWAMQSLRHRECDAALAGGVNLILSPETTIAFSKARMLSPDGRCRPFDAGANGYVRGEGCALVVLKRLTDAQRDGDTVLAVIRASAVNQDGRTSGITAPNARSQQAVIRAALQQARWSPDRIDYIEAHGTATPLGDPIEMESLSRIFRRASESDSPCYVTSVKANIGHTETVSGVAGLIKVVLMLRHGIVPAQLHFQSPNPHFDLEGTRLQIPRAALDWRRNSHLRAAGVSSFGFGGTNTHLLVEESPPLPLPVFAERPRHILTLSAKSQDALSRQVENYSNDLRHNPDAPIGDVCFTANAGRSHFQHRLAVCAATAEELFQKLDGVRLSQKVADTWTGQPKAAVSLKTAFLFTGQGSQYAGMGRTLYETHPQYRRIIDECDEMLRPILNRRLVSVLFPDDSGDATLDETAFTQPALFAHEYALAQLWRSWGIEPSIVLGHSVGEYAAACIAGAFSLEHGLRLIAHRGRLMQALPSQGKMVVAFAPVSIVQPFIESNSADISFAAINGPENTVVSGREPIVDQIVAKLEANGIRTQPLRTSHAFHSPLMEPMLEEFERLAADCDFQPVKIPLISNLTGSVVEDEWLGPEYWRRHVRQPVRFSESVIALESAGVDAVIEIGPSPTLIGMARRCVSAWSPAWLPSLRKDRDDWTVLLGSLAQLYTMGAKIDWPAFDREWPRRKILLPTYPFHRARHWFEPKTPMRGASSGAINGDGHPLLGSRLPAAMESTLFESRLSNVSPSYLADHQVQGSVVFPAAAYIEQALAAADRCFGEGTHVVLDLAIQQPLFLPDAETRVVQIHVAPEQNAERAFEISSMPSDAASDAKWTLHAYGKIRHSDVASSCNRADFDLDAVRNSCGELIEHEECYRSMRERGLNYGPQFRSVVSLRRGERSAIAEYQLPEVVANALHLHRLHPSMGDALLQSVAGVIPLNVDGSPSPYTYLPAAVRSARVVGASAASGFIWVQRNSDADTPNPESIDADAILFDASGNECARFEGIRLQRVGRPARDQHDDERNWVYQVDWIVAPIEHTPNPAKGQWVVFSDDAAIGQKLSCDAINSGNQPIVVARGNEYKNASAGGDGGPVFQIDPENEDHYRRLFEELPASLDLTVVHMWSLDTLSPDAESSEISRVRSNCATALNVLRSLARRRSSASQRLVLVTRGAQFVPTQEGRVDTVQSPLWGLGRVAAVEHPELRVHLVDLDPSAPAATSASVLRDELNSLSGSGQVAFRDGVRHEARLKRAPDLVELGHLSSVEVGQPFRVRLNKPGSFDELRLERHERRSPSHRQVEIEVRSAGANFSDVLKVMGLYPGITDEVVPLGIEASGIVTAVGDGVDRFQVGDEVLGVVPFSFASHAITADYALTRKPTEISHAEAATIPITFLTAHYALCRLGRLRRGERVLIHAGAGGVGLAAIQIAQRIGAEIFATAGSDEKRDYLRQLGVPHVFSTRSLDFADHIRKMTNREGVDVVLNSLPGDAIAKSLSILRAYGRFLEIGKIDIYQNRSIGLLPFQDNLSYFAIDLDRMLRQRPDDIRELFDEVMARFADRSYRPLPFTEFPAQEVAGALRYMSQRKNTGKVVVSFDSPPVEPGSRATSSDVARVRADGTYLITGGLGALGLQTAQWLAAQGAGHIALLSRRETDSGVDQLTASIRRSGAQVVILRADVADRSGLRLALEGMPADWPPLRGVFHAAGVLDDGILFDMSVERLHRAMAPKVDGAWNLHELALGAPLDYFVLFSSVASILGSPGQGNYAAGNSFLDALCCHRRQRGMPALSVNWGPWAGGGMAAAGERTDQLKSRGLAPMAPARAFDVLDRLLKANASHAVVADVRWNDLLKLMAGRTPSLLTQIAETEGQIDSALPMEAGVDSVFRQKLLDSPLDERRAMLRLHLSEHLGRIMGIEATQIDVDQPLNSLGLDSLMAMELKSIIETKLGFTLPMASFFSGPSVASLADDAAKLLTGGGAATSSSWSPLVLLEPGGNQSPHFCVHPVGGDVRCYFEFARHLGGERPVYAIAARGLTQAQPPHASMSEMIADYAAAIESVQPAGSVHLIGWSTGGIYAAALAQELTNRGREIAQLTMLDCPHPTLLPSQDLTDEARFLCDYVEICNHVLGAKMEVAYHQLRTLDPQAALETVLAEAKEHQMVPSDASIEFVRRFIEVGRSTAMMLQNYVPPAMEFPIHHFVPRDAGILSQLAGRELPLDRGWGDAQVFHRSAGDHFSMLTSANAAELADQVRQLLNRDNSALRGATRAVR